MEHAVEHALRSGENRADAAIEVLPERDVDGVELRRVFSGRDTGVRRRDEQARAVEVRADPFVSSERRNALRFVPVEHRPGQAAHRTLDQNRADVGRDPSARGTREDGLNAGNRECRAARRQRHQGQSG